MKKKSAISCYAKKWAERLIKQGDSLNGHNAYRGLHFHVSHTAVHSRVRFVMPTFLVNFKNRISFLSAPFALIFLRPHYVRQN